MKKNGLLYLMVAGIVLGIFSGWMFGSKMLVVEWIGEMFLDALKMLVVPLIISSMIVGIAGLGDIRKVGKTGLIALGYFMATTCIAVIIGLVMVNIIEPGAAVEMTVEQVPEKVAGKESVGVTDILKSFVSPNLVESMVNMDILPLIVFSLIFGGVLTTLGEPGKRAIDFFVDVFCYDRGFCVDRIQTGCRRRRGSVSGGVGKNREICHNRYLRTFDSWTCGFADGSLSDHPEKSCYLF